MHKYPPHHDPHACDWGCGSLGCSACRQASSESFAAEAERLFKNQPSVGLYTVIPLDGIVELDGLPNFKLDSFLRRNRDRLASRLPAGTIFAGAVDVCLNVFDNVPISWNFHVHGILSPTLTEGQKRKLRQVFPTDPEAGVHRATCQNSLIFEDVDTTAEYSLKHFFTKRSGFLANPRSDRNPYIDNKSQALSVKQDADLQQALSRYRVTDPLILIGLKRKRSSDPTDVSLMRTRG